MSPLPQELKVTLKLQTTPVFQAKVRDLIDEQLLTNCQCDAGAHCCVPLLFSRHYLFHAHQPYLVGENQDAAGSQVRQANSTEPFHVKS